MANVFATPVDGWPRKRMLPTFVYHRDGTVDRDNVTIDSCALICDHQAGLAQRATQIVYPAVRLQKYAGIQSNHAQQQVITRHRTRYHVLENAGDGLVKLECPDFAERSGKNFVLIQLTDLVFNIVCTHDSNPASSPSRYTSAVDRRCQGGMRCF